MTDEQLFLQAIELELSQHDEFLSQKCEDTAQARRVSLLLAAHQQMDSLLPAGDMPSTIEGSTKIVPGVSIGVYRLREQIGEGGMGVVYVAEQDKPVRRKVALKLIKVGMDTKEVTARFEAERQALAMMDHPNIARVLDAGSSDSGRPYFVMELVRGIAITEYCDEKKLTIRERLELFVSVCRAIQHAHQKGIIHRDIKPSNVLVTEHDGKPVAKVIDFGVAKAIGQRLTDQTVYTHHLQPVGTFLYMSPEQSRLSGLDIDTRSDVYALGLLLYELVTGTLPFDRETFGKASFDEKRRIIAEEEAPRPSTKVSTLGNAATTVCRTRGTDVAKLKSELKGELDWILVKTLEKDRNRRYQSAVDLASDVSNYLCGGIVSAKPYSNAYQLRKLIQRHRSVVTMAALLFAVSLVWAGFSSFQWLRAARLVRQLNEKNEWLQGVLIDRAIADAMSGNFQRAEISIQQSQDAGADPNLVVATRGLARFFAGEMSEALADLKRVTSEHPESIEAWAVRFLASLDAGEYEFMGECREHLLGLQPKTDTERMLRAMTNMFAVPEEALAELDQIKIGQPNSVVLRILRAIALREAAKVRTSSDSRRTALDESLLEFESVAPLMPSNRFLQTHYLNTISNRIQLLKQQQDMESEFSQRFTELSVQGNQIALRLEQEMKSEPFTRVDRATFYSTVGQNAKFRQITLSGSEGATASRQSRAAELFKLREYDRLHRFIEEHEYAWATNVYHAFATIETATDTASRQQAANKAFTKVFDSHDHAYGNDVLALEVFLLAGNRQALRENANRLSKNKPPSFEWHMYQRTLELFQTELSEDDMRDYLQYAEPFNEECSYAYYVAGLVVMTRGSLDDRELAKSYFQRCLQAGKFDWWSHVWADAFLSRLQEGDNWPAWIEGHRTDTH